MGLGVYCVSGHHKVEQVTARINVGQWPNHMHFLTEGAMLTTGSLAILDMAGANIFLMSEDYGLISIAYEGPAVGGVCAGRHGTIEINDIIEKIVGLSLFIFSGSDNIRQNIEQIIKNTPQNL